MVWEAWVQSQVESCQRFLKWYLILPCLTLSNIMYVSRVKWSNPGKGVAPSPSYAQRVSAATITILPITVGSYLDLNCFGHVTYAPQTRTFQNIAKPLICPISFDFVPHPAGNEEKDAARLFWTNPGSSPLQNSSCSATYLPSHKPSK